MAVLRKLLLGVILASLGASAQASRKDCDELRSQIEAKLHRRGLQGFSLDIVEARDTGSARVVGTCDHGKYRIVYARGGGRPTPDVPKKTAPAPKKKNVKKTAPPKKKTNPKPAPVPAIGNY
jgi:hypothetical protein